MPVWSGWAPPEARVLIYDGLIFERTNAEETTGAIIIIDNSDR
jgi:hypothetical protein